MQPLVIPANALPGQTEAELVRRAARGDNAAFEALVAAHADRAFRTARAILGNEPDARDATQDAFISAWRELPRLREVNQFEAWLRRILVNGCRSRLRVRGRVREIPMDGAFDRSGADPLIADQVVDTDMLARAFDRLVADTRAILVLHYLLHEPVAAIASAMAIPAGTVKWRLHRAREALERALLAEGEDPR
jgi:RNA polymerase sigma-70 factor (ECF subfamily)